MDQQFVSQLQDLLLQTTLPDSARIAQATNLLKSHYYVKAECLPALVHIMQTAQEAQLRQLAAVEARKQATSHWTDLSTNLKQQIRASLLQSTLGEQHNLVRHASSRLIANIARIDFPAGEWDELPGFLVNAATAPKASDRLVGVYVLYTLFDAIDDMEKRMRDLFQLFAQTLQDPESLEVRVTTLLALGKMSESIEGEDKELVKQFRNLLPGMVRVLQETVDANDSDHARQGFEVFQTLLILEAALIAKHIGDLINFMVQIGANKQVDDEFRVMALSFVLSCVRYRKNKVKSLKIGPQLTLAMLQIGAEEDSESPEDDCPSRMAYRCIDTLSTSLPPSHVYEPLLQASAQMMNSSDPTHRKSALTCMGVGVEGAVDFVSSRMPEILQHIHSGLRDTDGIVQRAALMALGQLADELPNEIASQHESLLPLVFNLMHSQGPLVGKSATNALDAILEGMDKEDIMVYLSQLMSSFFAILNSTADVEVKTVVVAAIGSAAHSSEDQFAPYFEQTMQFLLPCLDLHATEQEMDFRAVVTDTIGAIAGAVGKEQFAQYTQVTVNGAVQGMQLEHPRLRECAFCFFAILARVYGQDFAPFVGMVVPALIKSLEQGEMGDEPEEQESPTDLGQVDTNSIDADDDEDDEEDLMKNLGFNSAIAMEKEIAADAIGEIFAHSKSDFMPFLELSTQKLIACLDHFYEGVRKSAVASLWRSVATLYSLSNPQQWLPGIPAPIPLHDDVQKFTEVVRNAVFEMWVTEDEKLVVIDICRNLSETVRLCGPAIIGSTEDLKKVCELTLSILQKQHPCQTEEEGGIFGEAGLDDEDAVEAEDDDSAEFDALLIDAAADVVISLSFALGEQFTDSFNVFLGPLLKFQQSHSTSERATLVAALGEVAGGLKANITPFTEQIFGVLMRGLNDSDAEVRSNSAYAMGLLCEFSKVNLSGQYMSILGKLQPLFTGKNHKNASDNALGCTARMTISHPNAIPLAQVLPVMVSKLPLKTDWAENAPVYRMISQLYRANDQNIMALTEQLVPVFAQVLSPPEDQLNSETRSELINLVKALEGQFPGVASSNVSLAQFVR